jgi:serine phosphatase RsbU (regulator of sigma subunit)
MKMRSLSLKLQTTLLAIILVAGLVAAFSWNIARNQKIIIRSELIEKVVLQGRNLALNYAKPLLHTDPEFELHPHISRMLENSPYIESITVVDLNGNVKGHSDLRLIDTVFGLPGGLVIPADLPALQDGERLRENESIFEVSAPITDQGELIGTVHLSYSKIGFQEAISDMRKRAVRIGVVAMIVGSLVSLLFAVHITRPVRKLAEGVQRIGEGHLDTRINIQAAREIQALAHTFNNMAESLEKNRLALREKERIDRELEIAREIQKTLLPERIPEVSRFRIDAFYQPASQVGGDYFDIIDIGGDNLMFVVGDVAGKGVPGLVVMAMVRIMVRDLAMRGERPARLLRHLNMLLRKDIRNNMFVTLFCGILDTCRDRFDFASAAHMPLYFYRESESVIREYGTKAKPLGLFDDGIFSAGLEESSLILEPGDLVFQFTDGLNETHDSEGQQYGLERVRETIARLAPAGAQAVLSGVRTSLDAFRGDAPMSDDLTLLAVSLDPEKKEACSAPDLNSDGLCRYDEKVGIGR